MRGILLLGLVFTAAVAQADCTDDPGPLAAFAPVVAAPCGGTAAAASRKKLPTGYASFPMKSANVVNAMPEPGRAADAAPRSTCASARGRARLADGEMLVSGGFTGDYVHPVVDVLRDGKRDNTGAPKTSKRGGMAILDDGSIVVCQQDGSSMADLQRACGRDGKKVVDFIGGGALLVKDGRNACGSELYEEQQFTNGAANGNGLTAQQMRRTDHVVIAVKDGVAHVVLAHGKTGAEIQRDLSAAGFDQVLKLDGGSGYFACDKSKAHGAVGSNPMAIRFKKN